MLENFDYFNRINFDLLNRIPLNSKKILEVGCGAGAMALAFKNRCPNCEYIGIEQSPEASLIAKSRIDNLLTGDVESDIDLPDNLDCLIYGDVLEHLKDPWRCVSKHVERLNDSGTLIACIPNAQHWSMLNQLIYGKWQLNDQGLFDKTHLRWFTLENIRDLIKSSGLSLVEIKPRVFNKNAIEDFVRKISPALSNFGVNEKDFIQGISPLQYIVRAVKNESRKIIINYVKFDLDVEGLSKSRMEGSLKALSTIPNISCINSHVTHFELLRAVDSRIKILNFYRPIFDYKTFLPTLQTIIKNKYLIIVDFDDHPNVIKDKKNLEFTLKCCHAIHTTNEYLANIIRQYNPEVYVFENNVLSLNPIERRNDKIKIFFGALNRQEDWKPWMNTINKAISNNPEKWYFEVIHDRQFYDYIDLPPEQKSFTPLCKYEQYLKILATCDVSFMPLQKSIFNQCKSDLKAVQAASNAVVILSTPVVYENNFVNNKTASFFSTEDELLQILSLWSENPEVIRKIGKNAQEYVASNRLYCHQINTKIESFHSLWRRRDEISQDIVARIATINQ